MPLQIFDLELSGLTFNSGDPRLRRDRHGKAVVRDPDYDNRYDFSTFVYDCFAEPELGEVTLLCPPFLNFHELFDDLKFAIDGVPTEPLDIRDLSRCSIVSFVAPAADAQVVTLSHPLFGANLAINPSFLDAFDGKNAIFSISQNNRLEWIRDWLEYYVKAHGANAVVLSDNNSTAYSPAELKDTISSVSGIETAAIIRARYPFGPTDAASYSALYLQRSMAELCRRRILGRARAVVGADIDELFHSFSGSSIFDATVAAPSGYIRADAEWVYAKDTGEDEILHHRDHGFVSGSGKPKANRKWCVAPQGPQKGRQWLTHFLGSRTDPVDPDFRMWHCRQVSTGWKHDRSPENSFDLKENPDLRATMARIFSTPTEDVVRKQQQRSYENALIITSMKNEGPFILEWIAYHRAIGFTQFLVYTNDCSDGTDDMLDRLQQLGVVQHQRNKVLRRGPQKSALKHAMTLNVAQAADWIFVSDIDEFLNIKVGQGQVQDLLDAVPKADVIPVTWRLFSNNGVVDFVDESVIGRYTDAQIDLDKGGLKNRFVKSLFRKGLQVERFGTHGPVFPPSAIDSVKWVAPNGQTVTNEKEMTRPKTEFAYEVAQINHYATRSVDAYLVKKDRGRVNHYKQIMELDYWKKMCHGGALDTSIQRHVAATESEIDSLLSDDRLRKLHDASVSWYHGKIKELRQNPEFESMRQEILGLQPV